MITVVGKECNSEGCKLIHNIDERIGHQTYSKFISLSYISDVREISLFLFLQSLFNIMSVRKTCVPEFITLGSYNTVL